MISFSENKRRRKKEEDEEQPETLPHLCQVGGEPSPKSIAFGHRTPEFMQRFKKRRGNHVRSREQ
jgi:hypothetical protein